MKAVWYDRQGAAAEVLTYGDLPTPSPGPGEVLVRLATSGVNPLRLEVPQRQGPADGLPPRHPA